MSEREEERIFENKKYNQVKDLKDELTEYSDVNISLKKNNVTKSITREVIEIRIDNKEDMAKNESSILKKRINIDLNAIPDCNNSINNEDIIGNDNQFATLLKNETKKRKANSPNSQTQEVNKAEDESKKLLKVIKPETIQSKFNEDTQRKEVFEMSMNSICNYLNYRLEREKDDLHIEPVDNMELFTNVYERKLFLRNNIKTLLSLNPANQKVIGKIINHDVIFKKFVECNYENFYKKLFLENNRYLTIYYTPKKTSIFLSHFYTFEDYLTEEKEHSTKEYLYYLSHL